jgi:hypothetical protein
MKINVFLMGFLLNGVLSDFKESERLPGELSACLENLTQEVSGIRFAKPEANVSACLILPSQLSNDILRWFHKKTPTNRIDVACEQSDSSAAVSLKPLQDTAERLTQLANIEIKKLKKGLPRYSYKPR